MVTPCYHADRGNFYSKHPAVNKKQETIKKNWIPLDFRIDVKTMIIITLGWLNDKLDLSCSNYIGGSHIISSQDENLENKGKPQISLQWEVNCQDLRHLLHCWCLHCQSPIRATAQWGSSPAHGDYYDGCIVVFYTVWTACLLGWRVFLGLGTTEVGT